MKHFPLTLAFLVFVAVTIGSSTVSSQRSSTPSPPPQTTPQRENLEGFTEQEIKEARKKGVIEAELAAYLRARKQGIPEFKPGQQRIVFDDRFISALKTSGASTCTNGGFEMGNFTNWSGSYGSNTGGMVYLNTLTPGFVTDLYNPYASRHSIMPMPGWPGWQGPFDPMVGTPPGKTPIPLPVFPGGGAHMLRLGNPTSGSQAETANIYFQVTAANADFRFRFAVVLQDPLTGHTATQKPFFGFWIYDLDHFGPGSPIIDAFQLVADHNDPFFESNTDGSLVWRRVSCHRTNLAPYIGHHLWVMFDTADCSLGAHFAYAYIDSLCETEFTKPVFTMGSEFCPNQPIMADGTQTEGETSYTWSVVETDPAGNNPVAGTLATETFPGQITAPKNIRTWYTSKGKVFQCGKYYKVTLRTDSECSNGDETSKVILVSCLPAPVIAGPANTCDGGGTYTVNPVVPGVNYTWTILNGTPSTATGPSVLVTWNTPAAGSVIVSATNSCGSKAVILKVPACKDKCCQGVTVSTNGGGLTPLGGGAYTFNPTLTAGPANMLKVSATIISTSISYPTLLCGLSGPASSYVASANSVLPFQPPFLAVPYSREVVWSSPNGLGTNIATGKVFPFKIQLPPPPAVGCGDVVTFCVKYTFTDMNCNTCELVACYQFQRFPPSGGVEPTPVPVVVGPDGTKNSSGGNGVRLAIPGFEYSWLPGASKV